MPLSEGTKAPDFTKIDQDGKEWKLGEIGGWKLLVFYKVTCPTCQLTLPFMEKLHRFYGEGVKVLGIIQDPPQKAKEFMKNYGLTFPQLIDAPEYPTSIDYDVQVVPTYYLIDPEGTIVLARESFVKKELEELGKRLAEISGKEENPLFEDVSVPAFKAG
jgi:peroxiredoxin